jgi:site-specific DNA-adenine methylase
VLRVTILSECGISLCERFEDSDGTVNYCDPPYLVKGAKYTHDFTSADHKRWANALQRFQRTRVVVSYYAASPGGRKDTHNQPRRLVRR